MVSSMKKSLILSISIVAIYIICIVVILYETNTTSSMKTVPKTPNPMTNNVAYNVTEMLSNIKILKQNSVYRISEIFY